MLSKNPFHHFKILILEIKNLTSSFFNFFKMMNILLRRQLAIGRRFSVNKVIEVENLKETSCISQRITCDIKFSGSCCNIPITKEMKAPLCYNHLKFVSLKISIARKIKIHALFRKKKKKKN